MNVTLVGPSGQAFVMKVAVNYSTIFTSYVYTLGTGTVYEYNPQALIDQAVPLDGAEYNIAEFSDGIIIENVRASVGGAGEILQAGFETTINGAPMSLQKLDILTKTGRIL